MRVVKKLRDVVTASDRDEEQETDTRSTSLYRCDDCGTVFVSESKDACSRCGTPVESVPTEEEIGCS